MSEKECLDYLELVKNKPYKKIPLYKLRKKVGRDFIGRCLIHFIQQTFYKDFHAFLEAQRQDRCQWKYFYIDSQNIPEFNLFNKDCHYDAQYLRNGWYRFFEYDHRGRTGVEFNIKLNDETFGKLHYTDERVEWNKLEKLSKMLDNSKAYQDALWYGYAK